MYSHIEAATARREIALAVAVAVMIVGLWAVPAPAGEPITFTVSEGAGVIRFPWAHRRPRGLRPSMYSWSAAWELSQSDPWRTARSRPERANWRR